MNQNNSRLLKAISTMQNQVTRLERRQPFEAVSSATYTANLALGAGVETFIPYNYFYINQGFYYNEDGAYWVCMSAGIYNISMTLATSVNVSDLLVRMYIGTSPTTLPAIAYQAISVGSGVARNLHAVSFSTPYPLVEGWTFRFSVQSSVACDLTYRNFQLVQLPAPMISIVQIAQNYPTPANANDWYYEDTEPEPR